jgi:hypothetical protein
LVLIQLLAELRQFSDFLAAGCASNNVAHQTPDDVRLVCFKFDLIHKTARNGGEGIAVEIAKWRQPMAFPAKLCRFMEQHPPPVHLFPKTPSWVVAIVGGFVKRLLRLAKSGVGRGNELPVKGLKPRFFSRRRLRLCLIF